MAHRFRSRRTRRSPTGGSPRNKAAEMKADLAVRIEAMVNGDGPFGARYEKISARSIAISHTMARMITLARAV